MELHVLGANIFGLGLVFLRCYKVSGFLEYHHKDYRDYAIWHVAAVSIKLWPCFVHYLQR